MLNLFLDCDSWVLMARPYISCKTGFGNLFSYYLTSAEKTPADGVSLYFRTLEASHYSITEARQYVTIIN